MSDVVGYIDVVFFFKQKTAYDMRISDWSSDVCSSDLPSEIEFPFAEKRRLPGRRRRETLQSRAGGCIVGGGITRLGEGEARDQRRDGDMPDCCFGVWMRVRHETSPVGRGLICASGARESPPRHGGRAREAGVRDVAPKRGVAGKPVAYPGDRKSTRLNSSH